VVSSGQGAQTPVRAGPPAVRLPRGQLQALRAPRPGKNAAAAAHSVL